MKPRVCGCEAFFIFAVSKLRAMLKFKCPLLVVTDMEKAITFYEEVIGDRVAFNFGELVRMSNLKAASHFRR